ncbi:hypothetical protein ACFL23_00845 [Patescibacteria group bacterium]
MSRVSENFYKRIYTPPVSTRSSRGGLTPLIEACAPYWRGN